MLNLLTLLHVCFFKGGILMLTVFAMLTVQMASASDTGYYVATNGNDNWSGKLAKPNKENTDGPFASITRARNAIRELKESEGGLKNPVTTMVRGGTYYLDEAILFTPEDSGTEECPVIYQAYPDEKPILSGGCPIKGWKKGEDGLWFTEIPEVNAGDWYFNQLFVNGERRIRARIPNAGCYFRTVSPLDAGGFYYKESDLKEWENLEDVVIVLYHSWETSTHYISSLDTENCVVKFKSPAPWTTGYWEKKQRYYVENVFEGLDTPGEWYLNRKTGFLYYYPLPGEDMEKVEVVAPLLDVTLVNFKGKPEQEEFIEHIYLKGLSFQHANAYLPEDMPNSSQAAFNQQAAIMASGLHNGVIENCEVANVGEYGIWLRAGCQDNRIFHCHIHSLGAGGVRIGEGSSPETESLAALRNVVDNNFIHDGGYLFHGAIGIWVGRSSYNSVTHNEICDFDYTGISVGWSWGYASSSANHNIIEHNHVHHLGSGDGLSDSGGIYTLGISPGTKVRYNLFHDLYSYPYISHGSGIYPDEGTSEMLIENNIVYNVRTSGFFQHYGRENIVRNNIFAFSGEAGATRCREEDHITFYFEHNILICEHENMLSRAWSNGNYRIDNNLYWNTSGGEIRFVGMSFEEWQEKGNDGSSIIADPMFVDAKNYEKIASPLRDFQLNPNSPALKIGFKPIDMSKVGLYGEPGWVNLPKKIVHRQHNVPPPPSEEK